MSTMPTLQNKNFFPYIGCLFIHIPKTGGTSISDYLSKLDTAYHLSGHAPKFIVPSTHQNKHAKGFTYKETLESGVWRNSFKFCIIRNPFDLMVSSYHWWTQKMISSPFSPDFYKLALEIKSRGGFNEFLQHEPGINYINECRGRPQHWFLEKDGQDLVDFVHKIEEIQTLPSVLSKFIDVPNNITIEKMNPTVRTDYRDYYHAQSIDIVAKRFEYVIKRFG